MLRVLTTRATVTVATRAAARALYSVYRTPTAQHLPLAAHCARSRTHRSTQRSRLYCTAGNAASPDDEDKYLELLQLRDIKSEAFYDHHAQERRYFYYIDLQGRLFLENTRPKNIATSLKSAKFLKFFFSQLRPNAPAQSRATHARGRRGSRSDKSDKSISDSGDYDSDIDNNNNSNDRQTTESLVSPTHATADASTAHQQQFLEYPYCSPCGKEMNFIKCADRPFVFEDFYERATSQVDGAEHGTTQTHSQTQTSHTESSTWVFAYGGGELTTPFDPRKLKISRSTGRLYHDIPTKYAAVAAAGTTTTASHMPSDDSKHDNDNGIGIALIKSQLAVEFGRHIDVFDEPIEVPRVSDGASDAEASGDGSDTVAVTRTIIGELEWQGQRYPIEAIE